MKRDLLALVLTIAGLVGLELLSAPLIVGCADMQHQARVKLIREAVRQELDRR